MDSINCTFCKDKYSYWVPPLFKEHSYSSYMWRASPTPPHPRISHNFYLPRVTSFSSSVPTHNNKTNLQLIFISLLNSPDPHLHNKSCWSVLIRVAKSAVTIWSLSMPLNYAWPVMLSVTLLVKFKTLETPFGSLVCSILEIYTGSQAYILSTKLLFSELFNLPSSGHPTPVQPASKLYQVFGYNF